MMSWRWVWFRSRLTAVLLSGLVWLVCASIELLIVAAVCCLLVLVAVCWRAGPMLWCRYRMRRVGSVASEAIWHALVPVEWLRGRSQPRLWASGRPGLRIVAPDPHQLVLHDEVVRKVEARQLTDEHLRRAVVRAIALTAVNRSRLVAVVETFCLPWFVLAGVGRALTTRVASPVTRLAWRVRWLFITIALVDLWQQGNWPGVAALALTAVLAVTTPRWDRAWAHRQAAIADLFEQTHGNSGASAGLRGVASDEHIEMEGGRR